MQWIRNNTEPLIQGKLATGTYLPFSNFDIFKEDNFDMDNSHELHLMHVTAAHCWDAKNQRFLQVTALQQSATTVNFKRSQCESAFNNEHHEVSRTFLQQYKNKVKRFK